MTPFIESGRQFFLRSQACILKNLQKKDNSRLSMSDNLKKSDAKKEDVQVALEYETSIF